MTIIMLMYLLWLSFYDWREKQVPVVLLYVGVGWAFVMFGIDCVLGRQSVQALLPEILPGVMLILVAKTTRKAGMADGIVLSIMGVILGYKDAMLIFCCSLLLFSMFSLIGILAERVKWDKEIPYLPFLTIAVLVMQIL